MRRSCVISGKFAERHTKACIERCKKLFRPGANALALKQIIKFQEHHRRDQKIVGLQLPFCLHAELFEQAIMQENGSAHRSLSPRLYWSSRLATRFTSDSTIGWGSTRSTLRCIAPASTHPGTVSVHC